jgi:hypothetical protein
MLGASDPRHGAPGTIFLHRCANLDSPTGRPAAQRPQSLAQRYQALAAFFSLVKILAVGDDHIPEVLNFGSLELQPDKLSASGLKLVRVPQDIGLISPLSCAGAYDDRLLWHQLFESLPVVCEPAAMSLPSNRWNLISVFIGSPCACANRVI